MEEELFVTIRVKPGDNTEYFIDREIRDLDLPGDSLITIVRRGGEVIFPHGDTVLKEGDELFVIGQKEDIEALVEEYVAVA